MLAPPNLFIYLWFIFYWRNYKIKMISLPRFHERVLKHVLKFLEAQTKEIEHIKDIREYYFYVCGCLHRPVFTHPRPPLKVSHPQFRLFFNLSTCGRHKSITLLCLTQKALQLPFLLLSFCLRVTQKTFQLHYFLLFLFLCSKYGSTGNSFFYIFLLLLL